MFPDELDGRFILQVGRSDPPCDPGVLGVARNEPNGAYTLNIVDHDLTVWQVNGLRKA
jgi:hypothetical protein